MEVGKFRRILLGRDRRATACAVALALSLRTSIGHAKLPDCVANFAFIGERIQMAILKLRQDAQQTITLRLADGSVRKIQKNAQYINNYLFHEYQVQARRYLREEAGLASSSWEYVHNMALADAHAVPLRRPLIYERFKETPHGEADLMAISLDYRDFRRLFLTYVRDKK